MAWIKFEKDLLTDPRVLRIAKSLESRWSLSEETAVSQGAAIGNDVALPAVTLVCGALIRMWCLADTHLDSDNILPLNMIEIDEVVGIPGFTELLPADWFEPIDDGRTKLPNFHEHNGTEAKKKASTQKRVARFRKRNAGALQTRNASPLPDQTRPRPYQTKETSAREARLTVDADFAAFWQAYPNKTGKGAAEKAWQKAKVNGHLPEILAAIGAQKASEKWRKDGGQFIPNPATWINQRRWEDQVGVQLPDEQRRLAI